MQVPGNTSVQVPLIKKANLAFEDIEPFVLAVVVMRPRAAARRTDIEKSRELLPGLFTVEQHDYFRFTPSSAAAATAAKTRRT